MTDGAVNISAHPDTPKALNRLIKNGASAALVSALITIALDVYYWSEGVRTIRVYLNLVEVAITCVLAYGIYRRSRICAVLVLLLFTLNQIYLPAVHSIGNMIFITLFMLCFSGGVVGTFWYHSGIRSLTMNTRKVRILIVLVAVITSGLGIGIKYLTADSPQEAWHNFRVQIDKEHAKGVYPVRADYYTVVQDAAINGQTLIYTYSIENIRLTDISDAQLETQSRARFNRFFCATAMVQIYGMQVEYDYTQGLTEKTYLYNKNDCVAR